MSEVFFKDKLLSSAGIFPVYYWFVRSQPVAEFSYIREFLVRFDEERRSNRDRSLKAPIAPKSTRELLQYDGQNRSTDDIKSHEGRFNTLTRRIGTVLKIRAEIAALVRRHQPSIGRIQGHSRSRNVLRVNAIGRPSRHTEPAAWEFASQRRQR